jgi:hypothetical protein
MVPILLERSCATVGSEDLTPPRHIVIVAVSAEGAALRYRTMVPPSSGRTRIPRSRCTRTR